MIRTSAALFVLSLFAACAGAPANQDPEREAKLARARQLLDAGDPHEALNLTDALLKADADDVEARKLAAEGNLQLVNEQNPQAAAFLGDAIRNLRAARDLRPADPQIHEQLARALLMNGEFAAGRDAAVEAARLLRDGGATPARIADAVLLAADNEMQLFVDARNAEVEEQRDPEPATIELANAVLGRLAYARQGAAGAAAVRAARVYQWLNRPNEALTELQRGIEAAPQDGAVHDAFLDLHRQHGRMAEGAAAYRRMMRDGAPPILHWHLGRALVEVADQQRRESQFTEAIATYGQANAEFARYGAMVPAHQAGVNRWLAIATLSIARCQLESGDLEAAKQSYVAACEQDAACAQYDASGMPAVVDSFGGHYLAGLDLIGRRLTERAERERALRDSLAHYEWILARHPDQFGSIYNNAGLSARDLGNLVEQQARAEGTAEAQRKQLLEQAMALYEKSYQHYEKAVQYSPDDPRIVNDCGLMLIYHLHRDYDRAQALFERAIELGQPMLDALSADAPAEERNFLEEAVGDAWQNLAVMARAQGKPFREYENHLQQAVRYYPYQRREAAKLLQTQGAPPQAEAAPQDAAKAAAFAKVAEPARAKAASGDFDGALVELDAAAKELRGYAPWHLLVGTYCLEYARQAMGQNGSASQIEGLVTDAVANLRRAVELDSDPPEPRRKLAQAQLLAGEVAAAHRTANELLSHLRSLGAGDREIVLAAHALRANAGARLFIQKKGSDEQDEDLLREARSSFRELEANAALDDELRSTWVALEQWAGAPDQAFEIVVRALEREPGRADLVGQLVELGTGSRAQKAVELLAAREDALGQWFLGRARFNLALDRWSANPAEPREALATLDRAVEGFEAAMAKEPSYAGSSTEWKALALGAKGILQLAAGQLEPAREALLAAAKLAPAQATTDLGTGQTIKGGLQLLVDKLYQKPALGEAVALLQQIVAAMPADSDFLNNLGLMARDHGIAVERSGDAAAARQLYEISYDAYTRASQLEPDSIRLVNDRALLLIYHLHRDLEQAEAWLREAMADGQRRLDEAPPEEAQALRDLEESVGDCHQNLGYFLMTHRKDYPAARAELEKSLEYHPKAQRASTALLRQLERLEKGG